MDKTLFPAKIPNWRLIDSPDRPDCVEHEEEIKIFTTKDNVKYVRTPEERFENEVKYYGLKGERKV